MVNTPAKTIQGTIYLVSAPEIDPNNPYSGLDHPQYDPSIDPNDTGVSQANKLRSESSDFNAIFQEECLIFLLTADNASFTSEYSGERTREGYLIDSNGSETNFLPSQLITAGLDRVSKVALERFTEKRRKIAEILKV